MTDAPSRVLVSGGNGFVGRTVVRQLVAGGRRVCVLDNLRSGDARLAEGDDGSVQLLRLDLLDAPAIERAVADFAPDAVIHLAAVHFIPECEADPAHAIQTNVVGTVHLLRACPPGVPFVLASSVAVYAPSSGPHVESDSPVVPEDVYGFTKLHAEQWLRYFAARCPLRGVVVRLTNVLGPGETNPHVLPDIIGQLKAGSRDIELGNLESRRDYLDVDDAARALVLLAESGAGAPGSTEVINVASGTSRSVGEVVELLRRVPGVPDFGLHVAADRLRPVDRPVLQVDIAKATALGWKPTATVAETLERTWAAPDFGSRLAERYAAGGQPRR
jgi:UDP-glucose 4-epimerase